VVNSGGSTDRDESLPCRCGARKLRGCIATPESLAGSSQQEHHGAGGASRPEIAQSHDSAPEPRGLLRVTAPLTLTLTLFSAAVPRFLERFPQLSLDLRLDDRRINIVEEGFDIAIRVSGHLDDSSLVARRLANLQYVVCCSPSYLERFGRPSTPEDLQQHSCVRFTLSDRVDEWEFRKGDRLARVAVAGRYRVSSSLAVRDALLAGFGLSLVPRIYVADHLRRGQLTAVLEDWSAAETSVYALYPSKRHMTAKTNAFLAFLAEQLDP
jgi:DNA-binding transcriptional LysR family regulator